MSVTHPGFRIAELTAPEVAERIQGGAAIILPLGSLETHGPQAPMGDFLLAESIAVGIAETAEQRGADAMVLPAIPFGGEDFFAGVPGGISLSTPVLQAIIEEAIAALDRNGVRRILCVYGHGGSIAAVEAAARAARRKHGLVIPALHLWKVAGPWQEELGGDPRALEFHDRAPHIQRIAVACVGVGEDRQAAGRRHLACVIRIFPTRHYAHIGHAEFHGRGRVTGTHEGFESLVGYQSGGKSISHRGNHGDLTPCDQGAETGGRILGG